MNQTPVLTVTDLTKRYGEQMALNHFNLSVKPGEIIGIAGPNGAGKTTLFKILTGLTPNYEGQVRLFNATTKKELQSARKYVGAIIEDPAFYPELSARQNLAIFRWQRGVVDTNRVDELLEQLELSHTGKKPVKNFSLGMKQRLAIAQSLLHRPDLLIFDEPINGLDPKAIRELRQLFHYLAHDLGATLLISSHILSELEEVCDRFVIMNHGQKLKEFSKAELATMTQDFYFLRVDQVQKAATILEEKLHTTAYEVDEKGQLRCFDLSIPPEVINQALVTNNVMVSELTVHQRQLEDLFIQLVETPTKKG
ncbi:MAG: ABC transporter ATP-binding protein [Aerococcus sp.]|nr:ABC transporter ATP-binding protein [Aerococcus sp.]